MWRPATGADDDAVARCCLALFAEDPGKHEVTEANIQRTLARFRAEPARGRALVLEHEGRVAGYALLVPFWSNEAGGELCTIDELWVEPALRGKGHATTLIAALGRAMDTVGVQLEVTPMNTRVLALYERLGFLAGNRLLRRMRER